MHRLTQHAKIVALVGILATGTARSSSGDTLTARIHKTAMQPAEPVVVTVTLTLDEPILLPKDDPYEAERQLRRLRCRLVAELRADGDVISTAFLGSSVFSQANEQPRDSFSASLLGFFGDVVGDDKVFRFWTRPGRYEVVVRDVERGLESNTTEIELTEPGPEDKAAADLFRGGGLDSVMIVVSGKERSDRVADLFRRLALEYPETVYGQCAQVSLAMRRFGETFDKHNIKGGALVWRPVAANLKESAYLFERGHPLRNKALFALARAQAWAGARGDARQTAETLREEATQSEFARKAEQMLKELPRVSRHE